MFKYFSSSGKKREVAEAQCARRMHAPEQDSVRFRQVYNVYTMADSGVEVIIRKKPSFGMPSFGSSSSSPSYPSYPSSPPSSSSPPVYNPAPGSGSARAKKGLKLLLILVVVAVAGFGLYKGLPAVTSFVLASTGTEFQYTVTAKATETYTDVGSSTIEFTEQSGTKSVTLDAPTTVEVYLLDNDDLKKEMSFLAGKGDVIGVNFEYFTDGGGSFKVFKNGAKISGDLRISLQGVQLKYESTKEFNVERTAKQEGTAKISRNGKERQIVEVALAPKAEESGELSATTFEATAVPDNIQLEVRDGWLYAKYTEPAVAGEAA